MTLLETIRALDAPYVVWLTQGQMWWFTWYRSTWSWLTEWRGVKTHAGHRVQVREIRPPEPFLASEDEVDAMLQGVGT